MSTTVSYKGSTITTVNNETRTLLTQGKYLEANIILTDVSQAGGSSYGVCSNGISGHYTESYSTTLEYYPSGIPKAFIIYRTEALTPLVNNVCLAMIYDSQKAKVWKYNNNTVFCQDINITITNNPITPSMYRITFSIDDSDNAVIDNSSNYGIITIYGENVSPVFRTSTYNPPSGVVAGQFSVTGGEIPPIYLCGLDTTVTLAQYHRVETVVKADYDDIDVFNGTNFYTSNIGYYTDFTESYNNGTLTITSSGTNNGGYFHNQSNPTSQYTLYYLTIDDLGESSSSEPVTQGSATTPATTITANPTISVNASTGVITASVSGSQSITPTVVAGYVSQGTAGTVTVTGSRTSNLTTQAATTITPTTSAQTAVAAGRYTTGAVTVAAIPSNYVDSSGLRTYYTGSTAPTNSFGSNGDLYFQTGS